MSISILFLSSKSNFHWLEVDIRANLKWKSKFFSRKGLQQTSTCSHRICYWNFYRVYKPTLYNSLRRMPSFISSSNSSCRIRTRTPVIGAGPTASTRRPTESKFHKHWLLLTQSTGVEKSNNMINPIVRILITLKLQCTCIWYLYLMPQFWWRGCSLYMMMPLFRWWSCKRMY